MLCFLHGAHLRLVLILSIVSVLVVAQDATAIATASATTATAVAPSCAQSCIQGAQQAQNQCSQTDQACYCSSSSTIRDAISSCLTETKACSESDQQVAIAYYPQFCASYGLSSGVTAAETGANGIVTAAGEAPTHTGGAGANSLVLTSTADGSITTKTITPEVTNNHSGTGLTVPAILGITLGIFLIVCGIAACLVYAHVRRRQLRRRTRLEFLTSEFGDHFAELDPPAVQRPPRSQSINSHFVVQPSLPEKPSEEFDFGLNISRTSTLVSIPPPPPAKLDMNKGLPEIGASAYHVEDTNAVTIDDESGTVVRTSKPQRASTFKEFIGHSGKKLRASLLGSRAPNMSSRRADIENTIAPDTRHSKQDEFDESNKI